MKQINRKILSIVLILIGIIFLSYISACTNDITQNDVSIKKSVQVYLATPRALGMDLSSLSWEVTVKNASGEVTVGTLKGNYYFFESIPEGEYTFTATGKSNDVECLSGSTTTKISSDKENIITIIVNPIKTESTNGIMEITIELSEDILSIIKNNSQVSLYYDTQKQISIDYTEGDESLTFKISDLSSGYYTVYFEFIDTDDILKKCNPINNIISVISNCTTKITYTKNDYELVDEMSIIYVTNNENIDPSTGQTINNPIDIDYLLYETEQSIDSTYELILLSDVTLDSINYDNANSFTIDSFGTTKTITGGSEDPTPYFSCVKIKNLNLDGVLTLDNVDLLGNVGLNHKQYSTTTPDTFNVYKTANVVLGTNYVPSLKTFISVQGNWKSGDKVFDTSKLTVEQTKDIIRRIGLNSDQSDGYIIDNEGKYLEDTGDCPILVWNSTGSGLISFDSVKNDGLALNGKGIKNGQSVAFNGTDVYYIFDGENNKPIYKMGEDAPIITEDIYSITTPIYADSNNLYYVINDDNHTLKAFSFVDGPKDEELALGENYQAIAVDDRYVYAATQTSDENQNPIIKLRKINRSDIYNTYSQNYEELSSSEGAVSVTGMYIDGNELCVLFQNYESSTTDYPKSRGGVFKFNTSDLSSVDTWNNDNSKTRYRDSIAVSKDCYKTAFLLPTKIVGIYKRKLIIIDDGVSCIDDEDIYGNVDRVVLFDLDGATFDYNFSVNSFTNVFTETQGSTSQNMESHSFYTGTFTF